MMVNAIEGIVVNGRICLREDVTLPENTRVYVIVAAEVTGASMHLRTPRLWHPAQAGNFRKQVVEIASDAKV